MLQTTNQPCYTEGMKGYLTTTEAAKKMGKTRQWVHQLIQEGRLPGVERIGHIWVIPEEALDNIKPRKMGRPRKNITKE